MKIEIKTENAAFDGDYRNGEIARILREIATDVNAGQIKSSYRDINGNTVVIISD